MQTPVEIDFQGMRGRPEVQASIEHHVAELEQRYGRVTACRVVLKGPGGHHRTGGLYEVNIRLALPNGREVNVARTAQADERLADLLRHSRRELLWLGVTTHPSAEWIARQLTAAYGWQQTYQKYHNEARTHLSLQKDAPIPRAVQTVGQTLAVPILGGLHHQYIRA
jgi:hypothetical protein